MTTPRSHAPRHTALRLLFLALAGACLLAPGRVLADRGEEGPNASVSPRRAFWSSLLVPGWGQAQLGERGTAGRYLAVEAVLWSGFLGWRHVGGVRRDTYRTYAADHAGADGAGKSGEFFDDLGFYESRLQHNQFARVDEGADAYLYPATAEYFWEWDSEASRLRFRELRNAAQTARRNALYATGLVLANHLASAVHAARQARGAAVTDETGAAPPRRWPVELAVTAWPGRLEAAFVRRF